MTINDVTYPIQWNKTVCHDQGGHFWSNYGRL